MSGQTINVDFWFDPACPWAWITSRWVHEVVSVRPVSVNWHVMSLAILNGKPKSDAQWGAPRILTAIAQDAADPSAVLGRLYTELGNRIHVEKKPNAQSTWEEALVAAGHPIELVEAARTDEFDEELARSHDEGIGQVGTDVGTPVLSVTTQTDTTQTDTTHTDTNQTGTNQSGRQAFFGPVVTPIPRGEDAGRLWDGVLLVTGTDGFFELKRTRDRKPVTS